MITPDNKWTYYSPVADIGGPILRDKFWFYGGVAYTKNDNANDVTFRTDVSKTRRHFESWDDARYLQLQRDRAAHEQPADAVLGREPAQRQPWRAAGVAAGQRRGPGAEFGLSERCAERGDVVEHVRRQCRRLDQPDRVQQPLAQSG